MIKDGKYVEQSSYVVIEIEIIINGQKQGYYLMVQDFLSLSDACDVKQVVIL